MARTTGEQEDTPRQQSNMSALRGAWDASRSGLPRTDQRRLDEIDPPVQPATRTRHQDQAERMIALIFRRTYTRDLR